VTRRWENGLAALSQAWAVAAKDMRVYYLNPPMLMFGLILPVLLFFSFALRRGMPVETGIAQLMAMTLLFTASTAGPVVLILERRIGTFDRLVTAPMSLGTLLFGKTLVGVIFALGVAILPLIVGLAVFRVRVAHAPMLALTVILSALTFSAMGVLFGSFPAQSLGNVMMPASLIRWPLLFVSGLFIPLEALPVWARAISLLSPLTYSFDALSWSLQGYGKQPVVLDALMLPAAMALFLAAAVRLHQRTRRLGHQA